MSDSLSISKISDLMNDLLDLRCKKFNNSERNKNCILQYVYSLADGGNLEYFNVLGSVVKSVSRLQSSNLCKDKAVIASSVFLSSKTGIKRNSSGEEISKHDWKIPLDDGKCIQCCRSCVEWSYDLGKGSLDKQSLFYKSKNLGSSTCKVVSRNAIGNCKSAITLSVDEVKEFKDNMPGVLVAGKRRTAGVVLTESGDDILRIAQLPDSHFEFFSWFQNFCLSHGEINPDKMDRQVRLTVPSKLAVYNQYLTDCSETTTPVSVDLFYKIWNDSFSHVHVRDFNGIVGKCKDCALIERLCLSGTSFENAKWARILHAYHRGGYYGASRAKYYESVEEARQNQETQVMIDVDIMDQGFFGFPFLGTQDSLKKVISSGMIGVLEHHHGPHLYHFYDPVTKSANLVCHVILDVLEKWKVRKGCYPTKIFLNIDGGGENANSIVLGLLEFLVHKRVASEIVYFRNPPGHTHGPLDGRFGNVKRVIIAHGFVGTLDDLKTLLEREGLFTGLLTFTSITAIMDYRSYLEPMMDNDLARLHKLELTQLVWWFQAVDASDKFPSGVKVMYRAHAANDILELQDCKSSNHLTRLAEATGTDLVYTFVDWKPTAKDQSYRNCDGMYLLRKLPINCNPKLTLKPLDFVKTFDPRYLQDVLSTICTHFRRDHDEDTRIKVWWKVFFETAPKTTSVADYAKENFIPSPMAYIFDISFVTVYPEPRHVASWVNVPTCRETAQALVDASFLAKTLNSVEWSFDNHRLNHNFYRPPRFKIFANERLRYLSTEFDKWMKRVEPSIKKMGKSSLQQLYLRQCLLSNQDPVSYAENNIDTLTRAVIELHEYFYVRSLVVRDDEDTTSRYKKVMETNELEQVSSFFCGTSTVKVVPTDVRNLSNESITMSDHLVNIFMALLHAKEESIKNLIINPKTAESDRKVLGSSVFCSTSFYSNIVNDNLETCRVETGTTFTKLFVPCKHQYSDGNYDWSLVVAVVGTDSSVTVTHISPMAGFSEEEERLVNVTEQSENLLDTQLQVVCKFLKGMNFINIKHQVYSKKYNLCPKVSSTGSSGTIKGDTGQLLIINISFIYSGCNIYISQRDGVLTDFRRKFVQALMDGELPVYN